MILEEIDAVAEDLETKRLNSEVTLNRNTWQTATKRTPLREEEDAV